MIVTSKSPKTNKTASVTLPYDDAAGFVATVVDKTTVDALAFRQYQTDLKNGMRRILDAGLSVETAQDWASVSTPDNPVAIPKKDVVISPAELVMADLKAGKIDVAEAQVRMTALIEANIASK